MSNIPKQIHYCWFGDKRKPATVEKCIKSWHEKCPDYQIIEWNESNFNLLTNTYAHEAYISKYYAFCSDYVRLWVLYEYGGIYLDTDVELLKSLTPLLDYDAFFATEDGRHISTGLGCGAISHNPLVKKMLQDYDNIHFLDPQSNQPDKLPCPKRNTKILKACYPTLNLSKYTIKDGIAFLPKDYFCPLDYETRELKITDNTYGIHWFDASWMRTNDKIKKHLRKVVKCIKS